MWVRGLKSVDVDRQLAFKRRTPCECVDWNIKRRILEIVSTVALHVSAWIEITKLDSRG